MDSYWKTTTPGKGIVDIRNFDSGLVTTMGAIVKDYGTPPVQTNVIETGSGGCGGDVPVYFSSSDPNVVKDTVPRIVITRNTEDEAGQRIHPGHLQWRDRYDDSPQISGENYEQMEQSVQAWPYDISYDLDIRAATRLQVQAIWRWITTHTTIKPKGYITVIDSVGDSRGYDVLYDSISQADEIEDVFSRYPGLTITLRVLGEIDIYNTDVEHAVQTPEFNFSRK